MASSIERVFVAGAGLMGHGIAQVHAAVGLSVVLYEPELARAEAGRERIAGNLERAVAKGRMSDAERDATLGRISLADDPRGRPRRRPRDRGRLRGRRRQDASCGASSTGSRRPPPSSPRTRARSRSTAWPRRCRRPGAARFVRDALLQPGAGHAADRADPRPRDRTRPRRRRSGTSPAGLGKQVIVSADRPGFIVNRILMPFLAEAMRAYEEGLGTAEDIDTGARVGLNHPMGPLELADFIGLDVCLGVMRVLDDGLGRRSSRRRRCCVDLVAAGHLGQKTGRGFYTYPRPERAGRSTRRASPRRSACSRRRRATSPRASWRRRPIERDEAERYDRSLFTRMGELGLTAGAASRGRRRRRASRTSAGRWSWRSSPRSTWRWPSRCRVHLLSQYPVVTWGTDEQQARWLPAMVSRARRSVPSP